MKHPITINLTTEEIQRLEDACIERYEILHDIEDDGDTPPEDKEWWYMLAMRLQEIRFELDPAARERQILGISEQ